MKISEFFIERPIFAAVISTFITIAGALALIKLPVGEYPEVVPPSIVVTANYPGANPKVIADTVAAPLEQAIVGVDDMLYMSSTPLICSSSGDATVSAITFGFAPGYCALTMTEGGTTSGYSEIGSLNSEMTPPSSSSTDSTPAKIGRSIKNLDMFTALPACMSSYC